MINLETNKKPIKMRYILLLFVVIETLVSVLSLFYINNYLSDTDNEVYGKLTIPAQASSVSFSYDHRYAHYIQNGNLEVWDIKKNKLYEKIDEKDPIVYSYFMDDRNIIVYFVKTESKSGPLSRGHNDVHLAIRTFNLDGKQISEFGSIAVNNYQKIDQVVYSSLTNVIYINVSVNGGLQNIIYRMDIMRNKQVYETGKVIKNMVLIKNQDKLLYEDNHGNIYMDHKLLKVDSYKNFRLLGSDADDNVYLMPYTANEILKVKDQKILETTDLSNADFKTVINNKSGIFLVYDTYAVDIINNPNNMISFEAGSKLLDLFDHAVYTLNSKNEVNLQGNVF